MSVVPAQRFALLRGLARPSLAVALVPLLLVTGCPAPKHADDTGGGGFRVFYPDAGQAGLQAKVGKRMQAKPAAQCTYPDGREGRWVSSGAHVEQGALAPGLVLEDGAIGGVPTEAGTFPVTIGFGGVTCAGKPAGDQHVSVTIIVQ